MRVEWHHQALLPLLLEELILLEPLLLDLLDLALALERVLSLTLDDLLTLDLVILVAGLSGEPLLLLRRMQPFRHLLFSRRSLLLILGDHGCACRLPLRVRLDARRVLLLSLPRGLNAFRIALAHRGDLLLLYLSKLLKRLLPLGLCDFADPAKLLLIGLLSLQELGLQQRGLAVKLLLRALGPLLAPGFVLLLLLHRLLLRAHLGERHGCATLECLLPLLAHLLELGAHLALDLCGLLLRERRRPGIRIARTLRALVLVATMPPAARGGRAT